MVDIAEPYRAWVRRYVAAWNSNDDAEISALFTEDAAYLSSPNEQPVEGRDAIVAWWLENKDEPGSTSFEYEVLIADERLGIVSGIARYPDNVVYHDLWEISLDGNRCNRFVEWWMKS
jgi:ketosteroid isomerase-like protein